MILDREHDADPLVDEPVGRRQHRLHFDVRQIGLAPDADGENRHSRWARAVAPVIGDLPRSSRRR